MHKLYYNTLRRAIPVSMLAVCIISSCSKSGKPEPAPVNQPPAIASISVSNGPFNTSVIIKGTNFSATPANDQVFFNGKAAVVTAATTTSLTVAVPVGAGTGKITLSVSNGTAIVGPVFTYELSTIVSTLAGSGKAGATDGTGTAASFDGPDGIAVDAVGNLYVLEALNGLIRKITPEGVVSTFVGGGNGTSIDGKGTAASFSIPLGLTIDGSGNLYVCDHNCLIRKVTPDGTVSTYAGSGKTGSANGAAKNASFNDPDGITVDASGNIYVAEYGSNLIRKISAAGVVSTLAGSGKAGAVNGTGTKASFDQPLGLVADKSGNIYVVDYVNSLIRKISSTGVVTTFAGGGTGAATNGPALKASFFLPSNITLDVSDNFYLADEHNGLIRKIDTNGIVSTFAGNGNGSNADGLAANASFDDPYGITVDTSGNIYVCEYDSNLIRKITTE